MRSIQITFLGSGDAFGHGGRLQACLLVRAGRTGFLLDCGASAMISLNKFQVAANDLDLILISHLHGDHFGGLPFFILDAQLNAKRTRPLTLAGPRGLPGRLAEAQEVMFPGSSKTPLRFPLEIVELEPSRPFVFEEIQVRAFEVDHASGAPALALRLESQGKTLAYSGDTAWVEGLIPAARGADLLIAEAYFFEKQVKYHLSWRTLQEHLAELNVKRLILTHLGQDVLDRLAEIDVTAAEDGLTVEV